LAGETRFLHSFRGIIIRQKETDLHNFKTLLLSKANALFATKVMRTEFTDILQFNSALVCFKFIFMTKFMFWQFVFLTA